MTCTYNHLSDWQVTYDVAHRGAAVLSATSTVPCSMSISTEPS
jgi:hypothetical protein